jgi:hypothetical protein
MTQHRPGPEIVLSQALIQLTESIDLLLGQRHTRSALILLYTTIDILGSLLRPKSVPNTAGKYFKKWATDYMIKPCGLQVTADDLWGYRCGLLHTHTLSSDYSRAGRAREISHFRGVPTPKVSQEFETLRRRGGRVFVDIDALNEALKKGIRSFVGDIKKHGGPALHHAAHFLGSYQRYD